MLPLSTDTLDVLDWELHLFTVLMDRTSRDSQLFPLCLTGLSAAARPTVMAAIWVMVVLKKSLLNRKMLDDVAFLVGCE